jgi:hypothetical protein
MPTSRGMERANISNARTPIPAPCAKKWFETHYSFKDREGASSAHKRTVAGLVAGLGVPEGIGSFRERRESDGTVIVTFTPSDALLVGIWQENPIAQEHFARIHWGMSNTIAGKPCNEVPHRWIPTWDGFEDRPFHTTMLRWMGEPVVGRHLLVCDSLGIGDSLQFLAFLPTLKTALGLRRLTFFCRPALARLAAASGLADFVTSDAAIIRAEVFADINTDLWFFYGKRAPAPFLKPVEADRALWEQRLSELAPAPLIRVGLVWHGSPGGDRDRNLNPAQYACLSDIPGVRLFAVQKGPTEGAYTRIPGCVSLSADIGDMGDTAAILANLDLLISVDTSPVHLAGGMGVPTWVLLPRYHCPRWHAADRWYPSVRTYTAKQHGQWSDVLSTVRADLTALTTTALTTKEAAS